MKNYGLMATFLITFMVSAMGQVLFAEETTGEKIQASAHDAKRGMKKGAHRLEEAVCVASDVKCTSEKVKNRAVEVKDLTVDEVKKIKNKVD
jgi:hypothetical protein